MKRHALKRWLVAGWVIVTAGCWTGAEAQNIVVTDAQHNQLFTLSNADSSSSLVGSFGVIGAMAGLAYDREHDILYGSTLGTFGTLGRDNLYRIDRATGAATLIGALGDPWMHGLAYVNGVLYGSSTSDPNS